MNATWEQCRKAPAIDPSATKQFLVEAVRRRFRRCDADSVNASMAPNEFLSYLSSMIEHHYGHWVRGWCWGRGDGGLVSHWCCVTHSVHLNSDAELDATLDRIVDAIAEWRETIRELEGLFHQWHDQWDGQSLAVQVERATERIVNFVICRNDANDAWYSSFQLILEWFLESLDLDSWAIHDQLESIVEGRFASWLEPSTETIAETAAELGQAVEALPDATPPEVDTIQEWMMARRHLQPDRSFVPRVEVTEDAHRRFIEKFDFARGPERAERMLQALQKCREDAANARPLNWNVLRQWQFLVLGEPVDFRTTDAYAKGGRERYPITPGTPKTFRQCLVEANLESPSSAVALHAALRVYMDICMFHPFPDGNARSARLAMEYVLYQHGLALLLADPVFLFAREPQCHQLNLTLRTVTGRRAW